MYIVGWHFAHIHMKSLGEDTLFKFVTQSKSIRNFIYMDIDSEA